MATSTRVTFPSEGLDLVGDLYLPADLDGTALPAAVVTGSWTTVKEQMAGRYARRLADWGVAALAFDFRGFGESPGRPRDAEDPEAKSADIYHAVTFLTTRPEVDAARIGALGICASAGYTAGNTARDDRVRSLALVAPWLHDAELVAPLYGGSEGVAERVRAGRAARERYDATGEVDYVPALSETDPAAAMTGMSFAAPNDYYTNPGRGAVPQWPNRFPVLSWPSWLEYEPIGAAGAITVPTVIVHSEDAALPQGARAFHERLAGPKELVWTEGTQLDFYDQQAQVTLAVQTAAEHFLRTL